MDIEIVRFSDELLPALVAFSEVTWVRPRTRSFYDWRYRACDGFHRAFMAMRGSECMATVSAFCKPYIVGGRRVSCLEVFDWFCRPGTKGGGIGGKVMRAMMEEPEPIVAFGGTQDTLARLPHMEWKRIGEAIGYDLPLGREVFAKSAARRLRIPMGIGKATVGRLAARWYKPKTSSKFKGISAVPVGSLGEEVLSLYAGSMDYRILQVPDLRFARWLTSGYSGLGHFVPLYFTDGERLRGWSLSRLHRSPSGLEGQLVDIFWPGATADIYAFMVAESVSCLMSFRPQRVATTAADPALQAALGRNRFRVTRRYPIHFWGKGWEDGTGGLEMNHNYADWPIMPYPAPGTGMDFLMEA